MCRRATRFFGSSMRVAFVGRLNAGKSTLLNAFLGENVAPTGNGELTYNVSWIKHGVPKRVAHLVDGTAMEMSSSLVEELTQRNSSNPLRDRIRYFEIHHPSTMLRQFDLIDTPGLHSFYQNDSRKYTKAAN